MPTDNNIAQSAICQIDSTQTVICNGLLTTTSDDEDEYYIKTFGDMDGDHDIDISDIMLVVYYLLTQDDTNINKRDADVTWDGEVSINDVMLLVNIVLGENPPIPVYAPLF